MLSHIQPRTRLVYTCACVAIVAFATATSAAAQTSTTPGLLTAYSTIHSVGVEWDLADDADHDARATVEYRVESSATWLEASPLVRIDAGGRNMLAGSVMFLSPDTPYELRLRLSDPDGGSDTRQLTVRTSKVPTLPIGGRTFHVVPGFGGGDGSPASPFAGIDAAQVFAQPGDIFLLHGGDYVSRPVFNRGGTAAAHIVWKAAGDGDVWFPGIDIEASYLWFEGITVRGQHYGTRTDHAPTGVVITRATFVDNLYGIFLNGGGSGWYIADNTITGINPVETQSDEGEGIDLAMTSGHTIAHNRITNVADGVSYPRTNVDIFGNDIFDTSDDGLELDFGRANVRAWHNRIHNAHHNGISFQPQEYGPWYIIGNQIAGSAESPFKFRTVDRFALINNTIVNFSGGMICCNQNALLGGIIRNNLWISAQGGQIWALDALQDWRTDIDHNGLDWGDAAYPLVFAGAVYYDLPSFVAASGLNTHGVRIVKDSCFADFRLPGPPPTRIPPHVMTLRSGCNAVDAGARIPNLRDQFQGSAPDLGAHETGDAAAVYGPRSTSVPPTVTLTSPAWGATFTAPVTITLSATAADADGGVARVDFYVDGNQVATDAAAPFAASWATSGAGSYVLTAVAIDNEGLSASSSVTIAVNATGPPVLPGDWSAGDIGGVGIAGQTSLTDGAWTVSGSGTDIWSSADAFRFVSQPLSGDGAITVRVTSLAGADPWAKAGIMIREDLNPGSRHASLFLTPAANGLAFQRRLQTGGATSHTSGGAAAVPEWLRLLRTGSTFIAQRSGDGVNWVTVGTDSIAMATTVRVGLALTSHDNSRLATATYDSLSVASGGTPALPDLPGEWVSQDIGATGAAGTSGTSQGRWTISGAGADVWGTADAFHFAAQPLAGDGEIVARVSSLTAGDTWAKAGVMIRGSLDASSPHAFLFVTPGGANGVAFQRRTTFGGSTSHTPAGAGVAPVWLKLTRRGGTISASRSDDGVQWESIESAAIAMEGTVYAGLAVTSHHAGVLTTAEFEGVDVRGAGGVEWMDGDIGSVGHAGLTAIQGDSIGVAASGADIWGRSDEFRYVYKAVTGDFDFTSLVASVDPIDGWTKAGLMVRASASPDSAHASVFATPTSANGVAFQRRNSAGAASEHTAGPALSPSVWLRLTRRGAVITAWARKSGGDAWTAIGSETVVLPATALVGVAVTSHNDAATAVAVFEQVNLAP